MLDVMAGPHELDRTSIPRDSSGFLAQLDPYKRRLRLGYSAALGFARVEDEVKSIVESTLPEFERMGHAVEEARIDLSLARAAFMTIVLAENAGAYGRYLDKHSAVMDEGLVKFIEAGLGISAIDYQAAARSRDKLAAQLAMLFTECDLLLTPTVAVAPFPIGEAPRVIAGKPAEPIDWIPFTYPFNLTGNPAASLPCGQTAAGLPVGLQIVGPRHSDGLVLNLCAQFETARPWSHRKPPAAHKV
jgi:aspartyl-tRNA(Asn)/glutamyl-tRNA(Gln) amidotransferase subunit A